MEPHLAAAAITVDRELSGESVTNTPSPASDVGFFYIRIWERLVEIVGQMITGVTLTVCGGRPTAFHDVGKLYNIIVSEGASIV